MAENEKKNENLEEEEEGIYTLVDEDGKELKFGLLKTIEHNDEVYLALVPVDDNSEISSEEYVILKEAVDEDGETILITVDDDDEFDDIADIFDDELQNIDYDEE